MKRFRKYFITLTVGLLAVAGLAWAKDVFAQTEPGKVYHILCDVFFAVGTVMCCAGLLIFSSNEGTFGIFSYGISSFMDLFRPKSKKKYDTFYDYQAAHAEKKIPFGFLLICGLLFIAVSLVFLPLSS